MMTKKFQNLEISLIVPAHNAARVIEGTLKEYNEFLSSICKNYEIIIVCNACNDNTADITRAISKKIKHMKCLEIKERGKGLAILTGMKKARYRLLGFMDADNVFHLPSVKNMILNIDGYDCVIASKWVGRTIFDVSEPLTRKILAVGWRILSFSMLGLNFKDTQAGCKFLKKKAFDKIDNKFMCNGFDFDVELLYKLKKKGYSIKEISIPVSKSFKFSTFRLKFVPIMFWHIFILWAHNILKVKTKNEK